MKCPNCDCELELSLVQKTYEDSTKNGTHTPSEPPNSGSEQGSEPSKDIHQEMKGLWDKDYTIQSDDRCLTCGHERNNHGKVGCHHSKCDCKQFSFTNESEGEKHD